MKTISRKKQWVSTDGWRGYEQPINAVGGANDTGTWSDSPCPSGVCTKELNNFKKKLEAAGIEYANASGKSSNIFCTHRYVLVHPEDHAAALEIAEAHAKETRLFYSCERLEDKKAKNEQVA